MFDIIVFVLFAVYLFYVVYKVSCFFYLQHLLNKVYKIQGYEVKETLKLMLENTLECSYTNTYSVKYNKNNIKTVKQYLQRVK